MIKELEKKLLKPQTIDWYTMISSNEYIQKNTNLIIKNNIKAKPVEDKNSKML